MKLTINGVSVSFDKALVKEIVFNNGEVTIINEVKISSEYIKMVNYYCDFEGIEAFTGVVKDIYGNTAYYVDGKIHRDSGPALERDNGNKLWWFNGRLHRKDGPAIEYANGTKEWWFNDECHGYDDKFTNESWVAFLANLK